MAIPFTWAVGSACSDVLDDIHKLTAVDAEVESKTKKVKSQLEEETEITYTEFTPLLYMKLNGNYIVKVHVGGDNCVHVKFKMRGISVELMDFQDEKKTGDTLTKF